MPTKPKLTAAQTRRLPYKLVRCHPSATTPGRDYTIGQTIQLPAAPAGRRAQIRVTSVDIIGALTEVVIDDDGCRPTKPPLTDPGLTTGPGHDALLLCVWQHTTCNP